MFQPAESMPIENYSVVQPSTQQKTYLQGNICRFMIPHNSIPFIDPHSSYLQVLARVKNPTSKFALNGKSSVIIKYIRFSVNGNVIEEIDEYNQLAHLWDTYGEDESMKDHDSVFTQNSNAPYDTGLMGDCSTSLADGSKQVKLIIPLKETGLFGSKEVLPLMAFGAPLEVEIRFAMDDEVVQTYNKQRSVVADPTAESRTPLNHSTVLSGVQIATGANTTLTLAQPYVGWTSAGDCPLAVGDRVSMVSAAGADIDGATFSDVEITSVVRKDSAGVQGDGNIVELTFASLNNANPSVDDIVITKVGSVAGTGGSGAVQSVSMEYTRVEFYLQKVIPPAQYVEQLKRQIQSSDNFKYDVHTTTTYKGVVKKEIQSQTVEIPAVGMSRCKSVLIVPRRMGQNIVPNVVNTLGTSVYDFNGKYEDLRDYQFQVNNGLRRPTRAVNCSAMLGDFRHPAAEHLVLLGRALHNSEMGANSFKKLRENFCIGLSLSAYGGTTNLETQMRCYINYNVNTLPSVDLQTITYVNHINRISIGNQGLRVFT